MGKCGKTIFSVGVQSVGLIRWAQGQLHGDQVRGCVANSVGCLAGKSFVWVKNTFIVGKFLILLFLREKTKFLVS